MKTEKGTSSPTQLNSTQLRLPPARSQLRMPCPYALPSTSSSPSSPTLPYHLGSSFAAGCVRPAFFSQASINHFHAQLADLNHHRDGDRNECPLVPAPNSILHLLCEMLQKPLPRFVWPALPAAPSCKLASKQGPLALSSSVYEFPDAK